MGLIPGLGRSPGEGKGYPLQYSGLENSKDCTVHGVTKSQTWQNNFTWQKQDYIGVMLLPFISSLTSPPTPGFCDRILSWFSSNLSWNPAGALSVLTSWVFYCLWPGSFHLILKRSIMFIRMKLNELMLIFGSEILCLNLPLVYRLHGTGQGT